MKQHGFSVRNFARRFPTSHERWYVAAKLITDPLYPAVFDILTATAEPLLDVGCGMGVLSFYLRQRGWNGEIIGIDFDHRKISTASKVSKIFGEGLVFSLGDVYFYTTFIVTSWHLPTKNLHICRKTYWHLRTNHFGICRQNILVFANKKSLHLPTKHLGICRQNILVFANKTS